MQMKKAPKGGENPVSRSYKEQITDGLYKSTGGGPVTSSPLNKGHFNPKEMPMDSDKPMKKKGMSDYEEGY